MDLIKNFRKSDIIYLDNSATSFPKPPGVLEFATEFYSQFGVNVGRGQSKLEKQAFNLFTETRALLASHFFVDYPEDVIFSPSASIALNQIIFGLKNITTVYHSPFEHNSVLRPIYFLKNQHNLKIKEIVFKKDYKLDVLDLEEKFENSSPDVIFLTQVSNVTGYELPINEIVKLAKEFNENCIIIIDGAQAAGLKPLEINKLNIDYYVFSGHKSFLSGFGIAGWVMRHNLASKLDPFIHGGTGTISESLKMPSNGPSKFEVGSHNLWSIASLYSSLNWLNSQNLMQINQKTSELGQFLVSELTKLSEIVVYKPNNSWYPILSITNKKFRTKEFGNLLSSKQTAIRSGFHCAPLTHKWLGTDIMGGTVRISPGPFNSKDDITSFVQIVKSI